MPSIIIPSQIKKKITLENFEKIANTVLDLTAGNSHDFDYTIALSGNTRIKDLNEKYRGIKSPTDVLSFPAGELDPETGKTYLGDIIISYPEAVKQAKTANHSVDIELTLLIVHGMLHLVGFDHATEDEKHSMWKIQDTILQSLGIKVIIP